MQPLLMKNKLIHFFKCIILPEMNRHIVFYYLEIN